MCGKVNHRDSPPSPVLAKTREYDSYTDFTVGFALSFVIITEYNNYSFENSFDMAKTTGASRLHIASYHTEPSAPGKVGFPASVFQQ
jgi:hypothetical protein